MWNTYNKNTSENSEALTFSEDNTSSGYSSIVISDITEGFYSKTFMIAEGFSKNGIDSSTYKLIF